MENQKTAIQSPSKPQLKMQMILKSLHEIDLPEVSVEKQILMLLVLINEEITLDSLAAILALIFVYLMALITPIKALCLSLPKTPVFPAKSIKAVQFLSFT
jgi:hypothetical protein